MDCEGSTGYAAPEFAVKSISVRRVIAALTFFALRERRRPHFLNFHAAHGGTPGDQRGSTTS
ncbi:hypothetical protein CNY67_02315 [Desulfovibrio sp. G11]|nr:hypothetical protein CNY67_02315 [Desulfovibrio sp. G11]